MDTILAALATLPPAYLNLRRVAALEAIMQQAEPDVRAVFASTMQEGRVVDALRMARWYASEPVEWTENGPFKPYKLTGHWLETGAKMVAAGWGTYRRFTGPLPAGFRKPEAIPRAERKDYALLQRPSGRSLAKRQPIQWAAVRLEDATS